MDGQPVDEYGRPMTSYGMRPPGAPPGAGGMYDPYMNGGGPPEDEYDFGYAAGY